MLRRAMMAAGGGGGGTDPHWPNVVSLLHFGGADGSTTFADEVSGMTWTRTAGAEIDTAQSKFGGSSGYFPRVVSSGYGRIDSITNAALAFGTGDFTIEGWQRLDDGVSGYRVLFDSRPTGTNGQYVTLHISNQIVQLWVNNSAQISSGNVINRSGTWQHWALSRVSGVSRLFIDGVQAGSSYSDSNNYAGTRYRYGNTSAADNFDNIHGGWLDECRITKGVGRYSSNFTPPTAPFPNS